MDGESVAARVRISGRVQGVFFRVETRNTASSLGLNGWVRNLADGTVEALFEGDRDSVATVVTWCRTGPSGARVDGVDVDWEEVSGLRGFKILYS